MNSFPSALARFRAHFPSRLVALVGISTFLLSSAAVGSPNYVQGNYAVPQAPQTTISLPFTSMQGAGNINLVVIGWNDVTSRISEVTDSEGNIYQPAAGRTSGYGVSQAVYFAKNIVAAAAGSNSVTVTFNAAATYPDVRILEYSGLDPVNPLDAAVGAAGNGTRSSSGSLTTANPSDLLVAANTVQTNVIGVSGGFAQRLLTYPDADLVEDRVLAATGSWNANTPLSGVGGWVMQLVALRAASGMPSPTPTPTPSPATPAYVQGNYAVPQAPQTTVTLPFTAVQSAGHLNVVVVGWNDSTSQIGSVTDSSGNMYQLAIGPIATGSVSQSIYYAKNTKAAPAGVNAVTVTFTAAAASPDIRILEYSGIDTSNPLDASGQATGNSLTSSSGVVTTSNPTDLLVAANTVVTSTTGPDTGFTKRMLTDPDGDLVEDRLASPSGSYTASPYLSNAGDWVMQMVAFKSGSSSIAPAVKPTPKPTPTPTSRPTPSPTPTPKPTPTPTPSPTPTPTPTPTSTPTPSPTRSPAAATPAYIQGNYAVPQTPQTAVAVPYTAAQTEGNMNVVAVGWNDSSAQVSSVNDSSGNTYYLAVGPMTTGLLSQSIYFAANIKYSAAGANIVKVSFTTAANSPDIRILEYSGISTTSALDTSVGSAGSSATSSSGALTTTNSTDLLVGANTVETSTAGADTGYTARMITSPDGDLVQDKVVTTNGSYSANPPLNSAGSWVMQLAAFRAASRLAQAALPSQSVSLAWDRNAATTDTRTNTVGYRLYSGTASGYYSNSADVGKSVSATVSNLVSGSTYYFTVKAYNAAGIESPPSNEISYTVP